MDWKLTLKLKGMNSENMPRHWSMKLNRWHGLYLNTLFKSVCSMLHRHLGLRSTWTFLSTRALDHTWIEQYLYKWITAVLYTQNEKKRKNSYLPLFFWQVFFILIIWQICLHAVISVFSVLRPWRVVPNRGAGSWNKLHILGKFLSFSLGLHSTCFKSGWQIFVFFITEVCCWYLLCLFKYCLCSTRGTL